MNEPRRGGMRDNLPRKPPRAASRVSNTACIDKLSRESTHNQIVLYLLALTQFKFAITDSRIHCCVICD
jgi:hypothetical protein